ncbi:MAG: ABC transporter permease [Spirochaetes bacterium]|nr:ABC transporter permease [Spirochaetota bacterium]
MKRNLGNLYAGPMILWLTVFFTVPLLIIVGFSFLRKGLYGGVEWQASLDAWKAVGTPNLVAVTVKTFVVSMVATVITLALALPTGYRMARSKRQVLLLLLVIVPFWTNFLLRVFAWMVILGNNGFVNDILLRTGLVKSSLRLLNTQGAVLLVLVYVYLPYAILPLFSTIDKFDFTLLEAARDLGASKLQAIVRVLLPNIKGGIFAAFLFTFIPIFGAYAVPLLVGDMNSYMLGNFIADQLTKARNLPFTASLSLLVTFVTTIGILILMRLQAAPERSAEADAAIAADYAAANGNGGR